MSTIITPDYYETLEIHRSATQEEIKEAYRNLSIRFHPKRATNATRSIYEYNFHRIAEAYLVLSDPNKKGIYDIYGKDTLYQGIRDTEGNIKAAFKYTNNAMAVFNQFMNTTNPFSLIRDSDRIDDEFGSGLSSATCGQSKPQEKPGEDIHVYCSCTGAEGFNGCIKEIEYTSNKLNGDNRTSIKKVNKLHVEIFPGYHKNTVLKFPSQGNEAPGMASSNLIVHIKEGDDSKFKRVNISDLIYMCDITGFDALNSSPVLGETGDGRKLSIAMDEIISPGTVKLIKGEGMPMYNEENIAENALFDSKKGDLYLKFNIKFPDYINGKKKERIISLLGD